MERKKDPKLVKYVEEYLTLANDPTTYEERVGSPDELSSVIGKVSLSFQRLEAVISAYIIVMLGIDYQKGKIIVAELSFTNKVNVFSSLFHLLKDEKTFNHGEFNKEDYFHELRKAILKCQDLRNQVIHSNFLKNFKTDFKIIKQKLSAKSKNGLTEVSSEVEISHLFNISDFTISISMTVEEFFNCYEFEESAEQSKSNIRVLGEIFPPRV